MISMTFASCHNHQQIKILLEFGIKTEYKTIKKLAITRRLCNSIVVNQKDKTSIEIVAEAKITEIFCAMDEFNKYFDKEMSKYNLISLLGK